MKIRVTKTLFILMLFSTAVPSVIHAGISGKNIVHPQPFFRNLFFRNLWAAIDNNDVAGVEKALELDIDINKLNQILYRDLNGVTPLILSVWHYNPKIVELLAKKTDVNTQGWCGYTALTMAAWRGETEIAEILIKHGANVNLKDKSGLTPLSNAIPGLLCSPFFTNSSRDLSMLELLLTHKANINEKNSGDHCGSSLTRAMISGLPTIVKFLLKRQAHFNVQDKHDRKSLKIAKLVAEDKSMPSLFSNRYSKVLELLSKDKNTVLEKK